MVEGGAGILSSFLMTVSMILAIQRIGMVAATEEDTTKWRIVFEGNMVYPYLGVGCAA